MLSVIVMACALAFGQKADVTASKRVAKKFAHAAERSGDAGRLISPLALLPDSGLPKELWTRQRRSVSSLRWRKQHHYLFMGVRATA